MSESGEEAASRVGGGFGGEYCENGKGMACVVSWFFLSRMIEVSAMGFGIMVVVVFVALGLKTVAPILRPRICCKEHRVRDGRTFHDEFRRWVRENPLLVATLRLILQVVPSAYVCIAAARRAVMQEVFFSDLVVEAVANLAFLTFLVVRFVENPVLRVLFSWETVVDVLSVGSMVVQAASSCEWPRGEGDYARQFPGMDCVEGGDVATAAVVARTWLSFGFLRAIYIREFFHVIEGVLVNGGSERMTTLHDRELTPGAAAAAMQMSSNTDDDDADEVGDVGDQASKDTLADPRAIHLVVSMPWQLISFASKAVAAVYVASYLVFVVEMLGEPQSMVSTMHFYECDSGGVSRTQTDECQNEVLAPISTVYFLFCTISTLGYGDFAPSTTPGRILVSIIVVIGLSSFATASAYFFSLWDKGLRNLPTYTPRTGPQVRPHVIVTGNPTLSSVRNFLREWFHQDRQPECFRDIVFLLTPSADLVSYLNAPTTPHGRYLVLITGTALRRGDVQRAAVAQAEAVIILPNRTAPDAVAEDRLNALRVLHIQRYVAEADASPAATENTLRRTLADGVDTTVGRIAAAMLVRSASFLLTGNMAHGHLFDTRDEQERGIGDDSSDASEDGSSVLSNSSLEEEDEEVVTFDGRTDIIPSLPPPQSRRAVSALVPSEADARYIERATKKATRRRERRKRGEGGGGDDGTGEDGSGDDFHVPSLDLATKSPPRVRFATPPQSPSPLRLGLGGRSKSAVPTPSHTLPSKLFPPPHPVGSVDEAGSGDRGSAKKGGKKGMTRSSTVSGHTRQRPFQSAAPPILSLFAPRGPRIVLVLRNPSTRSFALGAGVAAGDIITTSELDMSLIGASAVFPGINTLISNLVISRSAAVMSYDRLWSAEFKAGAACEVYSTAVPRSAWGLPLIEYASAVACASSGAVQLLGVAVPAGEEFAKWHVQHCRSNQTDRLKTLRLIDLPRSETLSERCFDEFPPTSPPSSPRSSTTRSPSASTTSPPLSSSSSSSSYSHATKEKSPPSPPLPPSTSTSTPAAPRPSPHHASHHHTHHSSPPPPSTRSRLSLFHVALGINSAPLLPGSRLIGIAENQETFVTAVRGWRGSASRRRATAQAQKQKGVGLTSRGLGGGSFSHSRGGIDFWKQQMRDPDVPRGGPYVPFATLPTSQKSNDGIQVDTSIAHTPATLQEQHVAQQERWVYEDAALSIPGRTMAAISEVVMEDVGLSPSRQAFSSFATSKITSSPRDEEEIEGSGSGGVGVGGGDVGAGVGGVKSERLRSTSISTPVHSPRRDMVVPTTPSPFDDYGGDDFGISDDTAEEPRKRMIAELLHFALARDPADDIVMAPPPGVLLHGGHIAVLCSPATSFLDISTLIRPMRRALRAPCIVVLHPVRPSRREWALCVPYRRAAVRNASVTSTEAIHAMEVPVYFVCGDPLSEMDLGRTGVHTAANVIILADASARKSLAGSMEEAMNQTADKKVKTFGGPTTSHQRQGGHRDEGSGGGSGGGGGVEADIVAAAHFRALEGASDARTLLAVQLVRSILRPRIPRLLIEMEQTRSTIFARFEEDHSNRHQHHRSHPSRDGSSRVKRPTSQRGSADAFSGYSPPDSKVTFSRACPVVIARFIAAHRLLAPPPSLDIPLLLPTDPYTTTTEELESARIHSAVAGPLQRSSVTSPAMGDTTAPTPTHTPPSATSNAQSRASTRKSDPDMDVRGAILAHLRHYGDRRVLDGVVSEPVMRTVPSLTSEVEDIEQGAFTCSTCCRKQPSTPSSSSTTTSAQASPTDASLPSSPREGARVVSIRSAFVRGKAQVSLPPLPHAPTAPRALDIRSVRVSADSQTASLPEVADGTVYSSTLGESLAAAAFFDTHLPTVIRSLLAVDGARIELASIPRDVESRLDHIGSLRERLGHSLGPDPFRDRRDRGFNPRYGAAYLYLSELFGLLPFGILRHGAAMNALGPAGAAGRAPSTARGRSASHSYVYTCPSFEARVGRDDLIYYVVHDSNTAPAWVALLRIQRFARKYKKD